MSLFFGGVDDVVFPDLIDDFQPDLRPFTDHRDVLVVDLDRIDFLFEIGGFPFDLDIIADFEGRRDFDDRDGDLIKNVGDLTEDLWAFWLCRFSYRFLTRLFNFLLYGRFFRSFFYFL